MKTLIMFVTSMVIFMPFSLNAEQIKLKCNIHYRGLYDSYSVSFDSETSKVSSTNKHGVNIITQSKSLDPDIIVYNADSFYTFTIDIKTLKINRNFEINGNYAGEGSCVYK